MNELATELKLVAALVNIAMCPDRAVENDETGPFPGKLDIGKPIDRLQRPLKIVRKLDQKLDDVQKIHLLKDNVFYVLIAYAPLCEEISH